MKFNEKKRLLQKTRQRVGDLKRAYAIKRAELLRVERGIYSTNVGRTGIDIYDMREEVENLGKIIDVNECLIGAIS